MNRPTTRYMKDLPPNYVIPADPGNPDNPGGVRGPGGPGDGTFGPGGPGSDDGTQPGTTPGNDPPPATGNGGPTGNGLSVDAADHQFVEGRLLDGAILGTITDPAAGLNTTYTAFAHYQSATGGGAPGQISVNIENGNVVAAAGNVAPDAGYYTVNVEVTSSDDPTHTAIASSTLQVDDGFLNAQGIDAGLHLKATDTMPQMIATFTDDNPSAPPTDFVATINWTDITSSGSEPPTTSMRTTDGTVTRDGSGGFIVTGTPPAELMVTGKKFSAAVSIKDTDGKGLDYALSSANAFTNLNVVSSLAPALLAVDADHSANSITIPAEATNDLYVLGNSMVELSLPDMSSLATSGSDINWEATLPIDGLHKGNFELPTQVIQGLSSPHSEGHCGV